MAPKVEPRKTKQIVGMNSYDDPTLLPDGVVRLIQNMLPKKTSLETRTGWAKYNSAALPTSGGVFGLSYYAPTASLNLELAVSNGKLYSGNAGTFTERYDGLSATNLCLIAQFNDKALIIDQTNKMRVYKYGETTYTAGIDSPKEYKLVENFDLASDWTLANGTATNNTVNFVYGTQCIAFLTTAGLVMTASKTFTSINLTTFTDGSTSGTNDYISLFLIRGVYANFDSLTLEMGDGGSTNCYRILISGLAEWAITSAPDVAFELKMRKSAFTTVGSPNWNAITGVKFTIDAAAGVQAQIIVDYLRLEKAGPTASIPCTATNASNLFTSTAHGLANTNRISFSATTIPTGITAGTIYFVVGVTTDTFQVSLTSGGAAVTFTTDGAGIRWVKGAPSTSTACTAASATDIFTSAAHGLSNGDRVYFTATTLPTGITASTFYYVITVTTDTFQVSASDSGVAVNFTTDGTAVTWIKGTAVFPSGTYWYRVTFVTVDGWESDPSVISDAATVTLQQITLTNIPVPGSTRIASKKIYRLGGMSSEWRLLTILYDRTTTTYVDGIADGDLGDIQDVIEGQPYLPKCLAVHDRTIVIANLTSFAGTVYPCGVMVSEEDNLDIFDHDNFFEIEPNFGGSIKWILSAMDFIYVGKSDSIWKFDPDDLSLLPRNLSRIYGGVGPLAVVAGENEIFFLDGAKKVVSFNGSFFQDIGVASQGRASAIQNYLDLIPDAYIHLCWMLYHDNFLLVGIPQTGDTSPTLILAYYVPKGIWIVLSGWVGRCGYSAKIAGVNTLHLGHSTTGFVYNCFSGDDDAGTAITSIIQMSDGDFGSPEVRKDYAKSFLFTKKLTSTDVTLTVEPYLDTVDSTLDISLTIDSTTHKRFEIPMPAMGYAGTFLGLRMTATTRWSFRSLFEYARMIGVPL